jgi:hypothetical protein
VATVAAVHLGGILVVLALRFLSEGAVGGRLGVLPVAAVYGLPALLAALAFRQRPPLLLAAGVASLVLAVFPFSLHSFVYGPVGLIYIIGYARWPTPHHDAKRSAAAAALVSLLLVAAVVALIWHEDPICYSKDTSGEVTVDRDPDPVTSGSQTIEADSGIVETGCSSDTVVWWEALTSLALTGGALAAAIQLTRRPRRAGADTDET